MRNSPILVALWVCLLALAPLAGQTGSGAISGVVAGPDGKPLEDAEVELLDLASGKTLATHSDIAGRFAFADLRAGRYSVTVSLDGYAVRRMGPYEVLLGSPVQVAVELRPLSAPLGRPKGGLENMALEYGLVREQIEGVPVLIGSEGRTAVDKALLLVPGLSPVDALEVDPFTGRAAAVSANGSRKSAVNHQLDRSTNNAQNRITGAQAATFGPPPEALETFRVITHTFSASQGRNAGAVVLAQTRSGGRSWHGQVRGFWRPREDEGVEFFDGTRDSIAGQAGGFQIGGPIALDKGLFFFADAEAWGTTRRHMDLTPVLTGAELAGDFSDASSVNRPVDPDTREPFPGGMIPPSRFDPFALKFLETFVPRANTGEGLHRSEIDLHSSGEMGTARLDYRRRTWALNASYFGFNNRAAEPLETAPLASVNSIAERKQLSHNAQISWVHTPGPRLTHTIRAGLQRLSINRRQGNVDYSDTPAEEFGFDFESFGLNPGTLPDVTLLNNAGSPRFRITPFIFGEGSAQTTFQAADDFEYRWGGTVLRAGGIYRRGIWPLTNTENHAGSFTFSAPGFLGTRNAAANLLMGIPSNYRITTPRSLNLRWNELAFYGEAELRPFRGFQLTLGLRFEYQPPAVDRFDRLAAFREEGESERFPESLPNLIFPGDPDPPYGPLPRSTVRTDGRHLAPRLGLAYSPTIESPFWRKLLGESGRSVFRASYGVFNDFGTFAGSSAGALFEATFPPFSIDERFDFARLGQRGSFQAPLSSIPDIDFPSIQNPVVSYPIRVFDPHFDNAVAHHWTAGWQRLLPHRIFFSAVYVGTRSLRLQRQRELNVFERDPSLGFAFIERMRRFSRFQDVRSFESSGSARYNGVQLRANRFLSRGFALDVSYTWSQSKDNGSVFTDALATEPWAFSDFDRRHTLRAAWFYQVDLPNTFSGPLSWLDEWRVSGIWRLRSGLPVDVRQAQDPTFSFERIGRPDLAGGFRRLDPGEVRTFTLADGSTATGRFAFDPTAFRPVNPTGFNELRQGTADRNAFRMQGFQQWDLRFSRPVAVSESLSLDFGLDLLNAFDNKNWEAPFSNVDGANFGKVAGGGLGRTFQAVIRIRF